MKPIFIILYAVLVTLLLTLFFPRFREVSPRASWILAAVGVTGLLVFALIVFAGWLA